MADRSVLQRCESYLEQLPAQASTQWQNPIWEFLKGIEGFDDTRAAACLGRLLYAHYDSIGLLKLATKQDLIDDAGLKAGDALRIVSAAKSVAVCPESPPNAALPWPSAPNAALPWASASNAALPCPSAPNAALPWPSAPNATLPCPSAPNAALQWASASNAALPWPSAPNAALPWASDSNAALPWPPAPNATLPCPSAPNAVLQWASASNAALPWPSAPTAALMWASASYTPTCASQEARRKRAKTATQATCGRAGQDVVAPRGETIVISVQNNGSLTVPLHACGVCNVI